MSFKTVCALSHWVHTFCIGFYVAVTTRLGCTMLRAPRFSADYNNYCLYQAGFELGKSGTKDNWFAPNKCSIDGYPVSGCQIPVLGENITDDVPCKGGSNSAGCCPCTFEPIQVKPVEGSREYEHLFLSVGDVLCNQNSVPSSFLVASNQSVVENGGDIATVLETLRVCNPQTPWLNNPLTWSN